MDAPGRAPARREVTRQRVLDAASRCFAAAGFRRTRFDDIAAAAGVSRALLYLYFPTKADLLEAVRARAQQGWAAAVGPALARADDPVAALTAMVRGSLEYARTHPFLRALLSDDARLLLAGRGGAGPVAIEAWRARLIELLRGGVQRGAFAADLDVEHTADVLRAMVVGLIERMNRDRPIDVSAPAHVDAAVRIIVSGLRRQPPHP